VKRADPGAAGAERISLAALLVKVTATMPPGGMPACRTSHAMRWVMTRVFPEPAPASTSSGPPAWTTAARCAGLSESSKLSGGFTPLS